MPDVKAITSTADLRRMLIDTIEQVRNGSLEAKQASTIATLSKTILQSAKLDLDVLRFQASQEREGEGGDKNVLNLTSEKLIPTGALPSPTQATEQAA